MKVGPDISRVAALIGDPARANMLSALMDGRALTASELAQEAGVTRQTASAHLAQLIEGGLLERIAQGRHRFFRLHDPDVAHALEALMSVAEKGVGRRVRPGPRDEELRLARICYDHLAGELGVSLLAGMVRQRWLEPGDDPVPTPNGRAALAEFGIDMAALEAARRPVCRTCLDWSMRRHHLAGGLGAALLGRFEALGWARRMPGSRVVAFSPQGRRGFDAWLGPGTAVAASAAPG